ncbi:uncharacterized protein LOC107264494 isoform X2 [Cephus cinctus]|uniref:Uncharacterized protein LOC107264494 isoform X2 n=1 Tax=Cephus cinctus TaxID=211228 RepID=A0AAJ7BKH4_CEPCN|nr:uncharacterized protein LOC107264494 isoform X2 [Cephus cinctus]
MISTVSDFISGSTTNAYHPKSKDLDLCYAYPKLEKLDKLNDVLSRDIRDYRSFRKKTLFEEDGIYIGAQGPLTKTVVKPYQLERRVVTRFTPRQNGKLMEIAIREVKFITIGNSSSMIQVTAVAILFHSKIICKSTSPFNRQLYKILMRNSTEPNSLSIQVFTNHENSSMLPLPLPKCCIKNHKLEIEFSIKTKEGKIHSGIVFCTVGLNIQESQSRNPGSTYFYTSSNDPNDPRNCMTLLKPKKFNSLNDVNYFLLEDPALCLSGDIATSKSYVKLPCPNDNVIIEQPALSILDIPFRDWFNIRRPLRPSSGYSNKHRVNRKEVLVVSILRGVEVPIREESAQIQPLVEVEWCDTIRHTKVSEGPAPIWQETLKFEVALTTKEHFLTVRLFDQHPIWGLQFLGETKIPIDRERRHQEMERWVSLSPLCSPLLSFGYVPASPGSSWTRIYVLIRFDQPCSNRLPEIGSVERLEKAIQRCITVPYKIPNIEEPEDALRLAVLLENLPAHYGPLAPRQALRLNKVDIYGRAALLAVFLQGLGLHAYVLLGVSQIRKWATFVLTMDDNIPILWDPENGEHYDLGDNRCSLISVSRLINHQNIWQNIQKSTTPLNLRYNVKNIKDWRPIGPGTGPGIRPVQILQLRNEFNEQNDIEVSQKMEDTLKAKLSEWRSALSLPTIFNRHATSILRTFISKLNDTPRARLDKKELRQLYRAYHTHGFVLNLRHMSLDDLTSQFRTIKLQETTGPVEFSLVCHLQRFVGNTCSIWLATVVIRSKD